MLPGMWIIKSVGGKYRGEFETSICDGRTAVQLKIAWKDKREKARSKREVRSLSLKEC